MTLGKGWHQFDLICRQGKFQLSLDANQQLLEAEWLRAERGVLGFRGGRQQVLVDDVKIWEGGQPVTQENFRNDRHYRDILLANLLVLVGLTICWSGTPSSQADLPGSEPFLRILSSPERTARIWPSTISFGRLDCSEFVPGTRGDLPVHRLEGMRLAACQLWSLLDPAPALAGPEAASFLGLPAREP